MNTIAMTKYIIDTVNTNLCEYYMYIIKVRTMTEIIICV